MPKVNVIFDVGPQIGIGHQVRSESIAGELTRGGCEVCLAALESVTENFFTGCDVALFDTPHCAQAQLAWAKQSQAVTFALDYFAAGPVDVGVFVYLHESPQQSVRTVINGFDFVILRPEIIDQPAAERDGDVLIMLGGADVLGQTREVAERLSNEGHVVTIVQGPLAEISPLPNVKTLKNPADLPERMAAAPWAVTNAGGSLFEMLYLGTPVFVLPQTPFEQTIAEELKNEPGILGVGGPLDVVPPTVPPPITAAEKLIDGRGVQRICELVMQHCR
jgi:spore coat polysaccharide biosynthesis predicted glycosyltransferase SpsG